MSIEPDQINSDEMNILNSFARSQLACISQNLFADSSFLVLAVCAYLYGAESQLRQQSNMSVHRSQVKLVALIKAYFKMNTRSAFHMVVSIDEYAEKYYLVENIVSEGKKHAEKWLNCQDSEDGYLEKLASQYQHQSMFELGIDNIEPEFESQQKQMYSSVDQSVKKLRKRLLIIISVAAVVFAAIVAINLT